MTTNPDFIEALKHCRLIHFTLVMTSVTMAYFITISYSSDSELLRRALEFREFISDLNRADSSLENLNEEWVQHRFAGTKLGNLIDKQNLRTTSALGYRVIDRPFIVTSNSIETISREIDISFLAKVEIISKQLDSEEKWGKFHELMRAFRPGSICHLSGKTRWLGNHLAAVDFDLLCENLPPSNLIGNRSTTIRYATRYEDVRVPRSWREKFRSILERNDLASLSPAELVEKLSDGLTSRLTTESLNVLGLRVEARYAGVAGPLALLFLLLYLNIYLEELNRNSRLLDEYWPLPWLGVMSSWSARAMIWLTLFLLPTSVSGIAFYRLVLPSYLYSGLFILPLAILGLISTAQTRVAQIAIFSAGENRS